MATFPPKLIFLPPPRIGGGKKFNAEGRRENASPNMAKKRKNVFLQTKCSHTKTNFPDFKDDI